MSDPSKAPALVPVSSLGSISKPSSTPPSPAQKKSSDDDSKNFDDQIAALSMQQATQAKQLQQQTVQHAHELRSMKSALEAMMTMMKSMQAAAATAPAPALAASPSSTKVQTMSDPVDSSPVVPASASVPPHVPSVVASRQQVKQQVSDASAKLFDLSEHKQNAIASYASHPNMSFDMMNDSTIDMNNLTAVSSNSNTNPIAFLSQLMPMSTTAAANPSFQDIFSSGLKAVAATHLNKIKDVDALLLLLQEQAKLVVTNARNQTYTSPGESQSGDFLLYTLRLFKTLVAYGLQATLDYHFALMKLIQEGETKLTADQPMLMFEMSSKYKRLVHSNLLASQLHSSSKPAAKSGSAGAAGGGRNPASKFTGTPCVYHTKLLGKPANHSDADCRAPKGK